MKYSLPRGTRDILPEETPFWRRIEFECHEVLKGWSYAEIRTPIFEQTDLFCRSIGTTTDIVKKEMYTFTDRKGRNLTLRPEATASVVRACLENNLLSLDKYPLRLYYIGPMFRYERPQAGRQRQFHQVGVELFGRQEPLSDVEVIRVALDLFKRLAIENLEVDINSVGCKKCKPNYVLEIKKYFKAHIGQMCEDCKERLHKNPMRILDCKQVKCQRYIDKAPAVIVSLCADCKTHFDGVLVELDRLKINYRINQRLVRGLDYYTKTAFEIVSNKLGAQNAVCGGGRYDELVQELGGKPTPAVGFAIGLERLIEVFSEEMKNRVREGYRPIFIAVLGEKAREYADEILVQLREKGKIADMGDSTKPLSAQLKSADRRGAKCVCIIGDEELSKRSAILKDMQTGEQREVKFESLLGELSSF